MKKTITIKTFMLLVFTLFLSNFIIADFNFDSKFEEIPDKFSNFKIEDKAGEKSIVQNTSFYTLYINLFNEQVSKEYIKVNDIKLNYYDDKITFKHNDSSNVGLEKYKYVLESDYPINLKENTAYLIEPTTQSNSFGTYHKAHNIIFDDVCNRVFNLTEKGGEDNYVNGQCVFYQSERIDIINITLNITTYILDVYFISDYFIDPTFTITDLETDAKVEGVTCEGSGYFCHLNISNASLVLYMPFDVENDSTTVYDWSDYGNDGTLSGAVWNQSGGINGTSAYEFNVDANYINIGDVLNTSNPFTVSMWIKPVTVVGTVIFAGDGGNGLQFARGGDDVLFLSGSEITASNVLTANEWSYVTGVMNGTHVVLYVDGVFETSGTTTPQDNTNDFAIGSWTVSGAFEFNGTIDEVMIFNRSLSVSEISNIYNATFPRFQNPGNHTFKPINISTNFTDARVTITEANQPRTNVSVRVGTINNSVEDMSGLVLYMPFEWGKAWDISGWDNDGTVTNAIFNLNGGINNTGGYWFDDDIDRYIGLGNTPSLNIQTDQITVSAWAKGNSPQTFDALVYKSNSEGTLGYALYTGSSGRMAFFIGDGSLNIVQSGTFSWDSEWHYFVGTYDGANVRLYIDGIEDPNSPSANTGNIASSASDPLQIGIDSSETDATRFLGVIDEVMVFDRALSQSEISESYNRTLAKFQNIQYTEPVNLSSGVPQDYAIPPNASFIFLDTEYFSGNGSNPFWSPILKPDITLLVNDLPVITDVVLNSTLGTNLTTENLTSYITASDPNGQDLKNITKWYVNGTSLQSFIMPFEGGTTSSFVKDYSDQSLHGTAFVGTWVKDGGHDGFGAVNFSAGGSDGIEVTNGDLNPNQNFSMSFWARKNVADQATVWIMDRLGTNNVFRVYHGSSESYVFSPYNSSGSAAATINTGTNSVDDTEWHHVVVGYNGSSYIYLDGDLKATGTVVGGINSGPGEITIGKSWVDSSEFNGVIDDIIIYKRSLSHEQIVALYENRTDLIVSQETTLGDIWDVNVTSNDGISDSSLFNSPDITIISGEPPVDNFPYYTVDSNSTNSTFAGTNIEHRLQWNDDTQLDGFIFSFCNGTWDGTSCLQWDVSTSRYIQEYSMTAQDQIPYGIFFNINGTRMYMPGSTYDAIYEYELSTPWNVTTATYTQNFSIADKDGAPSDIYIRDDGLKMYIPGLGSDSVFEYNLSIAWNVSSATYIQYMNVTDQDGLPHGIFFKTDGTKMYIVGQSNAQLYEYDLSIAWNVSSATYIQNRSMASEDFFTDAISFNSEGNQMFYLGANSDRVYEYKLNESWNVTTATFIDSFSVSSEDNVVHGLYVRQDGKKMYMDGSQHDSVYEYDLNSSGWINDSFVSMKGTINWSNVTKLVPDTVGLNVSWKVYANDSIGQVNESDVFSYMTTSAIVDTCTYSSGDWNVDCGDNCIITSATDLGSNTLFLEGTGLFQVSAEIRTDEVRKHNDCSIVINSGGLIIE